jgi:pectate lyase
MLPLRRRRVALLSAATAAVTLAAAGIVTAVTAHAATACSVTYSVTNQWPGGFTASVTINNIGDPLNGWTLAWTFTAGQTVSAGWNANVPTGTSTVNATNASWNGQVATGASVNFGFNGTWNNSSNPAPTSFTLNGTVCNGGTGPTTTSRPPTSTTQPPTSTTQPPTTTTRPPTTTSQPPTNTGLVGWATQGGGTTGGAGGPTVTVTSLSAFASAVAASGPQTVRVSGMFSCSDDVRVTAGNKTILGVGTNSGLNGCGINISDVSNVIVRNMRIANVQAGNGNGDAIHVDNGTRIWIDHNDLSSNRNNGTDFYDGLVDMTHAADFITVSWNFLHDHIKCSLIGHSDNNAGEDVGHLRISYHHNYVSNCNGRNPRVRFGNPVHVFNNYYFNIADYGVASTIQGGVLVEGNYFENVPDPFHVGEGSSPAGSLVARNNFFVNSGAGQTSGSVAGIPYSYTLDAASSVKSIVTAGAGVGKIAT